MDLDFISNLLLILAIFASGHSYNKQKERIEELEKENADLRSKIK